MYKQKFATSCNKQTTPFKRAMYKYIAKSVDNPLTMGLLRPARNGIFSCQCCQSSPATDTYIVGNYTAAWYPVCVSVCFPGLASTATYASIIYNGKWQWSRKVTCKSPPQVSVPLYTHSYLSAPSPRPLTMAHVSGCECLVPICCDLTTTKLLPLSGDLSKFVVCCNNKCKCCASLSFFH